MKRREGLGWALSTALLLAAGASRAAAVDEFEGDPFQTHTWADMRRFFLGEGPVEFDSRVEVLGPAFAEDPMNVPITVSVGALDQVEQIVVLVDRNPIRKVLEYFPLNAAPSMAFRFKLEQASPVRAAARTRDGIWHVGGTWVDSGGGGCTAPTATRKDGTWPQTLGNVSARLFPSSPARGAAQGLSRLRVQVMHPMDTGLVGGIPAFYVNRLSVRDAQDRELLRLNAFEPVSENPVFSFDFPGVVAGGLRIVGSDNSGTRIQSRVE